MVGTPGCATLRRRPALLTQIVKSSSLFVPLGSFRFKSRRIQKLLLKNPSFWEEGFCESNGGNAGIWTRDHRLKRALLYQLSYVPINNMSSWPADNIQKGCFVEFIFIFPSFFLCISAKKIYTQPHILHENLPIFFSHSISKNYCRNARHDDPRISDDPCGFFW